MLAQLCRGFATSIVYLTGFRLTKHSFQWQSVAVEAVKCARASICPRVWWLSVEQRYLTNSTHKTQGLTGTWNTDYVNKITETLKDYFGTPFFLVSYQWVDSSSTEISVLWPRILLGLFLKVQKNYIVSTDRFQNSQRLISNLEVCFYCQPMTWLVLKLLFDSN